MPVYSNSGVSDQLWSPVFAIRLTEGVKSRMSKGSLRLTRR
jgi:hypothetical protein